MPFLSKVHALLAKIGHLWQTPVLLIIRLYWGWQFFVTGKAHLMYLEKTTHFFVSLHIPAPKLNAIMAGSTECVGGLLLLVGLFSRFVSLALICVMCVAYATAERESLNAIFSNPDKFLGADPFLFLYAAVVVFAFGPGKAAVDQAIFKDAKA